MRWPTASRILTFTFRHANMMPGAQEMTRVGNWLTDWLRSCRGVFLRFQKGLRPHRSPEEKKARAIHTA